jgi:hypothetical protein
LEATVSTVPTPINAELVIAAITALTAFFPKDREQVADMLLFWVRRHELTEADIVEVQDRMFPAEASRRDGYAEGYLDALDAVKKIRDEQRSAALSPTPAERFLDETAARWEREHQEWLAKFNTCPAWCTLTHDPEDDVRDGMALHMGDDHTDETVRKLLDAHTLEVRVARLDILTEDLAGSPIGTPNLHVRIDAELTTWEQAAELARVILDGFVYVPVADRD